MSKSIQIQSTREIFIKPYTLKEMANLYGINYRTFLKWIKPFKEAIGKKHGRLLTIPQVKTIFEKLDYPNLSSVKQIENTEKKG